MNDTPSHRSSAAHSDDNETTSATGPAARDMSPEEFRAAGHRLVEWIAEYLEHPERYPVLARVKPGEIASRVSPPVRGEGVDFGTLIDEFERELVPGLTHWNHPSFFAYFAISASGPGILADLLSAALNQQAMLWRTSPGRDRAGSGVAGMATRVDRAAAGVRRCDLRHRVDLDAARAGVGTGSGGARCQAAGPRGAWTCRRCESTAPSTRTRRSTRPSCCSGWDMTPCARFPPTRAFRMRPDLLAAAITEDRAAGESCRSPSSPPWARRRRPASIRCRRSRTSASASALWLHVDAAYAGVAAMVPGRDGTSSTARRAPTRSS